MFQSRIILILRFNSKFFPLQPDREQKGRKTEEGQKRSEYKSILVYVLERNRRRLNERKIKGRDSSTEEREARHSMARPRGFPAWSERLR